MVVATLTLDNPIFHNFLGYAGLVLVKTGMMSLCTSFHRRTKNVFVNAEDAKQMKVPVTENHPDVERVRRCHRNDMENVYPFVLLGILYVASGPAEWAAKLNFRIFCASRFIHTFVYLAGVPQPARGLAFLAGFVVNLSMAYQILSQASF